MIIKSLVRAREYHDSVALMLVARELDGLPGVVDASVVMATEANKALLKQAGLSSGEATAASSGDLVVVVKAESESAADDALAEAHRLLSRRVASTRAPNEGRPVSLRTAIRTRPEANVAVISVAGRYASAQTWDALHAGLHVLLFSDHVPIEDEIAFKQYARSHGLLMMGPGAGTAIINGVGLGFANAIPRGPVGIVSAAGTGLQEVSTLLAKNGVGVSQGIGTGGRDVSEWVGGIMMLEALKALQADPATSVILIVSKIPAPSVTEAIIEQVEASDKPTVLALMGASLDHAFTGQRYQLATLREAAAYAGALAKDEPVEAAQRQLEKEDQEIWETSRPLHARLGATQRYLRGLFSGGTLCEEATRVWTDALGGIWSNAPLDPAKRLKDPARSREHTAIDLGEEEFTVGRPHPMIDNELRLRRLQQEAEDPEVAVVVMDLVLGFGVHPDPAAELAPAISQIKRNTEKAGRTLHIVMSVTGTENDPQGLSRQRYALEKAGAIVMDSNGAASRMASLTVQHKGE